MGYEGIQPPVNATPVGLHSWAINHVAQIRRILNEAAEADADLTALQADVVDLQDRVTILEAAGGSGLTAQQLFLLSLTTATDEIVGGYGHLMERTRSLREIEADATIMAAIDANKANTGLKQEVRVRIEEDLSLVQTLTQLTADLGVTNADVTTLTQTVADGDSALATQISSLSSSVAGNTSQIAILTSSVDGMSSRFAVTMTNNNEITGFISLDGDVQGSSFTVAADYFKVAKVGTTGGTAVPVFAIQTVGGVPKLAILGDMYADGTITTRHLAADCVTADKISVTSLTAISAAFGNATVTGELSGGPLGKLKLNFTTGRIRALA